MVKKLFKHEYLAWLRIMPLIFGITLVVAGMLRLLMAFEHDSIYYDIVFVSAVFMFVVAMITTFVSPGIFAIVRFYKNMFTGEGYLTHTLPVTPGNHLWVKLLTAISFDIAALLVMLLAGLIVTAGEVQEELWKAAAYLYRFFAKEIPEKYVGHIWCWLAEFHVITLLTSTCSHLYFYLCICIGQLFRKNRILAAVGVYFGLYMVGQIISTVVTVMFTFVGMSGVLEELLLWIEKNPIETVHIFLAGSIVIATIMATVYFLICHTIIRKKLNLE